MIINNLKNSKSFLILSILIVLLCVHRFLIVIHSMPNVECEEAIPAVMAKHIIEHNYTQSLFDYTVSYATGFFIFSAFIAVPFFLLFGVTTLSLKMGAIFLVVTTLILMYQFLKIFFGYRVAILASILYILSPSSFTQLSLYAHSGLFQVNLFLIAILFIFFHIAMNNNFKSSKWLIFWGLICGFASWHHLISFIMVSICLIFWLILDRMSFFSRKVWYFALSFIIGFSPKIYYHLVHSGYSFIGVHINNGLSFKNALDVINSFFDILIDKISVSFNFFVFFSFNNKFQSYLYYFIVAFSYIYIIWNNRVVIKKIVLAFIPNRNIILNPQEIKEIIIVAFPLLYAICFSLSDLSRNPAPRYILPLYSSFLIILSIALNKLYDSKARFKPLSRVLSSFFSIFLIALGLNTNIKQIYAGDPLAANLKPIISALEEKGIQFAYVSFYERWPILFESNEKIITSSLNIWETIPADHKNRKECIDDPVRIENYPVYDRLVDSASNYAYAFRNNSEFGHNEIFKEYLREKGIQYNQEQVQGFTLYWNFSQEVRPKDIKFDKRWERKQN